MAEQSKDKEQQQQSTKEKLMRWITKQHIHPMSVHFPNGVFPAAVILLVIFVLLRIVGVYTDEAIFLAAASGLNLALVVLAMPVVIASGLVDWKIRYKGYMTKVFRRKIISGIVVAVTSIILLVWALAAPDFAYHNPVGRIVFLAAHLPTLIAAIVAGYYGGKLVLKN